MSHVLGVGPREAFVVDEGGGGMEQVEHASRLGLRHVCVTTGIVDSAAQHNTNKQAQWGPRTRERPMTGANVPCSVH